MYYDLKKATSIFEKLSRQDSKWTVFSAILDFCLIPYRYYSTGEELKIAHEKLLSWPDKEKISGFLTSLAELQPEGFGDPLGEFYMCHISHGHLGQYFTPEHISDMMANMSIGDTPQPGQTVLDPACGSGRGLLSAAKINRHLLLYGADLDGICCKMALLNMVMNSLTGEIAHMNSLSNEFFRGYRFQTKVIDGYHYPYFVEFTDPSQSYIWLRPPTEGKPTPVDSPKPTNKPFAPLASPLVQQPLKQGSLFD